MDRISTRGTIPFAPMRQTPATAPGFFTGGDVTTGQMATRVGPDWLNGVQEELIHLIEAAGLAPDATDTTQLLQALTRLTRRRLQGPATYYLSPDGNNADDGLSPGSAWRDPTAAYNYIRDRLDLNGFEVRVQFADGSYAPLNAAYAVVGPSIIFEGNPANPEAVIIRSASAVPAVSAWRNASIRVRNLTVTAPMMPGDQSVYDPGSVGVQAALTGAVEIDNLNFAACGQAHMHALTGGMLSLPRTRTPYQISGGAISHVILGTATAVLHEAAVTLTNNPAFSLAFAYVSTAGSMHANRMIFAGAATGRRFHVETNGVIYTSQGDPAYFPGDQPGYVGTGGIYA